MNKKGAFLIEVSFILPLLIALFCFLEVSSQGWTHRIQARMCSRYVSTFYFRNHTLPSLNQLKVKFDLKDPGHLAIENTETVSVEATSILKQEPWKIKMSFYLWTKPF